MPEPRDTARRVNRGEPMSPGELQHAQQVLQQRCWLHRAEVELARHQVAERIAALITQPGAPADWDAAGPQRLAAAQISAPSFEPPRPPSSRSVATPPGRTAAAEELLARAWASYERAEANMSRGQQTRNRLEKGFLAAAAALAAAGSPQLVHAWRGVALVRRYQTGRAAAALDAHRRALAADPHCVEAVDDYVDFMQFWATAAGLTEALGTIPPELRRDRLPLLVSTARRHDQWGNMPTAEGEQWLSTLPRLLQGLGDQSSLGWLLSSRALEEERTGSHDKAVELLREAVATGHATPQAVDRLTVRLVKQQQWAEAAAALREALAQSITSDTLRGRMDARLWRCEQQLRSPGAVPQPAARWTASGTHPTAEDVPPALVRAWAREHGYDVGDRGRLPADITHAFLRAQQDAPG